MELLMIRSDRDGTIHLTECSDDYSFPPPACGARSWAWRALGAPIDADLCAACLYRLRLAEAQGARR